MNRKLPNGYMLFLNVLVEICAIYKSIWLILILWKIFFIPSIRFFYEIYSTNVVQTLHNISQQNTKVLLCQIEVYVNSWDICPEEIQGEFCMDRSTSIILQHHTKCFQTCSLKRKHYCVLLACAQQEGQEMSSIQHQTHHLQTEQGLLEYFLWAHEHGATEQHRQIIFLHLPGKGSVNSPEFCRIMFITSCAASHLVICTTHSCQSPDFVFKYSILQKFPLMC